MSIDPSNTVLAAGSMDGYISFWDLLLGHHLFTLNAYSPVLTLEFRPQEVASRELVLMATCTDGYAKFWAINIQQRTWSTTPTKYHCKSLARDEIRCASFSPAGLRFITGATDGIVRLVSVPEVSLIKSSAPPTLAMPYMLYLEDHEGYVNSVHWSTCGTRFVTSAWDGCVREWNCDAEDTTDSVSKLWKSEAFSTTSVLGDSRDEVVPGRPRKVTIVTYCNGDQNILCAVNQSFELILFDRGRVKPTRVLRYHEADVFILTTNPVDDRIVLSAGCDGKAAIWFSPTGERLFDFQLDNTRFLDGGFSQDGSKFALVDDMGRVSIFGCGASVEAFANAPPSQFFPTDWNELIFDSQRLAVDAITQRPPHLAPRDSIVSIEKTTWDFTPDLNYALQLSLEVDEMLSQRQKQVFNRQLRNETRLFKRELELTLPGSLPKHSRSRRRRLLYGSDVEDEMVAPLLANPDQNETATAPVESADEDFQMASGSETDADLSVNSSDEEQETTPTGPYNLRQRTLALPRHPARRQGQRRLTTAELTEDDQLYRPDVALRITTRRRPIIEESSEEEEDEEDHFVTTASRTSSSSSRRRPASTTPSISRVISPWLTHKDRHIFPYLPQIHDVVVYFPEGHRMFLKKERRPQFQDCLPWEVKPDLGNVVFGQVMSLNFIPGEPTWCLLELMLLDDISAREGLPPPTHIPSSARKIQISFYDMTNQPDFIIPYCRYAWSVRRIQRYAPGEIVRVVFGKDESYEARVKRIKVPSERIPERPWQCYVVEWLTLEDEPESLSPWELETIFEEDAPDRQPYQCQEFVDSDVARLIDEGLQKLLYDARAALFKKPVDLRSFPDYLETVAYPMDITTIHQRLLRGYYRRVDALEWETRLIYENAYAYNLPDSDVVKDAEYVMNEILRLVKRAQRGTRRLTRHETPSPITPQRSRSILEREERARRRSTLHLHQQNESPESADAFYASSGGGRSLRSRGASLQLFEAPSSSSTRDSPRPQRRRAVASYRETEEEQDDFQTPHRPRRARVMDARSERSQRLELRGLDARRFEPRDVESPTRHSQRLARSRNGC